jgi:hypothetical protein
MPTLMPLARYGALFRKVRSCPGLPGQSDRRIDYNMHRPLSAHGWLTPVEFVGVWLNQQQLTLA